MKTEQETQEKKKSDNEKFIEICCRDACGIDATDEIFEENRVGKLLKNT